MQVITTDPQSAVQDISLDINQALSRGSVLFLVSGGSNIRLAVEIRSNLQISNQLTVGLIDERFCDVGHPDSNWQKLIDDGFDMTDISPMPVLNGKSFDQTTADYRDAFDHAVAQHDLVVGLFGMGTDGHTSGILPHSSAVNAQDTVVNFEGPDFLRITTTPASFKYFDTAYLAAFGEAKFSQLQGLILGKLPIVEQPAQALKTIKDFRILTDQIISKGVQ